MHFPKSISNIVDETKGLFKSLTGGRKAIANHQKTIIPNPGMENSELYQWMYEHSGFTVSETATGIHCQRGETTFMLRPGTSDTEVFSQIFCNWQYLPMVNLLKLNKIPATTIIDLGANIGLASVYFHEFFPEANYICVEPDAGNMAMLEKNLSGVDHKTTLQKAIWSAEQMVYMNTRFRDGLEWSASASSRQQEGDVPVDGITLNNIIRDNGIQEISILKVDIEGAEQMLFAGEAYHDFLAITRSISIELHEEAGPGEPILEKLRAARFGLWEWGESIYGLNYGLLG